MVTWITPMATPTLASWAFPTCWLVWLDVQSWSHTDTQPHKYSLSGFSRHCHPDASALMSHGLPPVTALGFLFAHRSMEERAPHPREELEMEFNEKVGQTVLIRCRAWPDQCMNQVPVYRWLLSHFPSGLLHLFLPKPPWLNTWSLDCKISQYNGNLR